MKYFLNTKRIVLCMILAGTMVTGCKRLLDEKPLTFIQQKDYFKNSNDFYLAMNGLYGQLMTGQTWGGAAYVTMTYDDDDTQAGSSYRPGHNGLYDMVVRTADAWKGFYNLVQKCNTLLAALETTDVLEAKEKDQMKSEALFLRAHAYFELAKRFGPVPLRLQPYIEGRDSKDICRESVEKIYSTLVSDLESSYQNLPADYNSGYSNKDRGKPTRQASMALLMKIYMHMAGAEVYGPSGSAANPAKEKECYSKAADLGKRIQELSKTNGFPALENEYMNIFDVEKQATSNEILFSAQSLTNTAGKGTEIGFTLSPPVSGLSGTDGSGGGQVTLRWDFRNIFDAADKRIQWGKAISDSFYNAKSSEKRWYYVYDPQAAIVATSRNGALPLGSVRSSGTVTEFPNVGIYWGANAGHYGWDKTVDVTLPNGVKVKATPKLYSLKYTDPKANGKLDNGCDMIILRYADVLLMLAEAENEINGVTPTALNALNLVRNRAGVTAIENGIDQNSFRDSVRLERRKELYFEFNRRWDLIRWGSFISTMNAAKRPRNDFQRVYPLPIEEISANGCINKNNEGW